MKALDTLLLAIILVGSYVSLVVILYFAAKVIFPFRDPIEDAERSKTIKIKLNTGVTRKQMMTLNS